MKKQIPDQTYGVIGLGRFGTALVKTLAAAGKEVIAVDKDEEKVKACTMAKLAGADFVKTSTGFSTGGAKAEDVALMRQTVGTDMGVKASGGVRSYADAVTMIKAGANRIGASSGKKICSGGDNGGEGAGLY